MKLIGIKRKSRNEKRFTEKMGMLTTRVVYVKQTVFNIPVRTLYKYRETYYGKVKDCEDCRLSA